MPDQLRKWKPAPDTDHPPYTLPGPDDEYWEIEAMLAAGYRLSEWQCEQPILRARMVAHHHEKRLREAHLEEWKAVMMKRSATTKHQADNPVARMRRMWSKPKESAREKEDAETRR